MGNHGATPPPLSPHPLPGRWATGAPALHPPWAEGTSLLPPKEPRRPGGGTQLILHATRPHAPGRLLPRGPRQASGPAPAHGSHPGTTRVHKPERYGGHALHTQSDANGTRSVACPGKAAERTEVRRSPAPLGPPATPLGRAAHSPPPPPPCQTDPPTAGRARRPGLPHNPGRTSIRGGNEPAKKGGPGRGPRAGPLGKGEGEPQRDPPFPSPPTPSIRPAGHRSAGLPPPPSQGGRPPLPQEDRSAEGEGRSRARTPRASTPGRRAPTGTATGAQTRAGAQRSHTVHARGRHPNKNRSSMQATPSMAGAMPMTHALFPAQGGQRDGPRQGRQAAPPPPPPPRPRRPALREAHNPALGRGGMGPGRPPPKKNKPNGARDRGRRHGGARTAWNGPTGAQHRDRASCARRADPAGGTRAPWEREHTHTHKEHAGNTRRATGPSPRNAQTTWNDVPASEDKGHPDMTTRHTQRGDRGAGGGSGEDTKPGNGTNPPEPAASAAHTRPGLCTRQGSSGTPRHAPTQQLGSLRASPRGSHWRQASSAGPAAPTPRATTH